MSKFDDWYDRQSFDTIFLLGILGFVLVHLIAIGVGILLPRAF